MKNRKYLFEHTLSSVGSCYFLCILAKIIYYYYNGTMMKIFILLAKAADMIGR
ncbi:hypothetical protein BDA99DRAFT_329992 [Phascolomyces articulosus]|uniref:Uncharacterized protein n=1 Tax=Phascolomyces articulosus TaxID=60185 RepID=A0AAD5PH53_9FUNG|nr:hypothetical protein BDA99DRAFT_329992 [Phascolomyces articulosus]